MTPTALFGAAQIADATDEARLRQRDEALHVANTNRIARARLKEALKLGDVTPVSVLRKPPPEASEWPVHEFLDAVPRIGKDKIRRSNMPAALNAVNLFAPLGELTDRQRKWLTEHFLPLTRWDDE